MDSSPPWFNSRGGLQTRRPPPQLPAAQILWLSPQGPDNRSDKDSFLVLILYLRGTHSLVLETVEELLIFAFSSVFFHFYRDKTGILWRSVP